jgi:hypothetical protein
VRALLLVLLAQPNTMNLNLNLQPIMSRQGGAALSTKRQYAIDCRSNMTCTVDGGVLLLSAASGGAGSSDFDGGYNVIEDEGVPLTKRTTLNFTGAGITCSDSGGVTTCTVSGGGGGSVNTASGVASFDGGTLDTLTTVTAAWASGSSVITCTPTGEEASVEGLITTVLSQAAGSFVVRAEPRLGTHWGDLPFVCIGN